METLETCPNTHLDGSFGQEVSTSNSGTMRACACAAAASEERQTPPLAKATSTTATVPSTATLNSLMSSSLLDAWLSRTPFYQHSAVGDFSEIDANYRRLIGQLQPHAEGAKLLALLFSCGVQFVDVDHQIIEQH